MSDQTKSTQISKPTKPSLQISDLQIVDILIVLRQGARDFQAAPKYGLFFGGVYALGGWALYLLLTLLHLPFLVYPLFIGFALIAPFMATGFYDVSRKLEGGESLNWKGVLSSVKGTGQRDLGWMALITGFAMIIWMDIAALLFFGFMGLKAFNSATLVTEILTTPTGLLFLALGNLTGAMISFFVFSITVVSFPLLFDRDVDFVTAMITSVKVVRENPRAMIAWWLIIAVLIAISLATLMVGLFLTLPILGHATWHLYRKAIT
jgi:uncharacterized membrane protein